MIKHLLCCARSLSHVQLFVTPWTVTWQAPLSMGFYRQEYWSGLPFPSLGGLPDPGIEPASPALQADSLLCEIPGMPYKCTSFIVTLWTVACQAPLSMEFSKKEY